MVLHVYVDYCNWCTNTVTLLEMALLYNCAAVHGVRGWACVRTRPKATARTSSPFCGGESSVSGSNLGTTRSSQVAEKNGTLCPGHTVVKRQRFDHDQRC